MLGVDSFTERPLATTTDPPGTRGGALVSRGTWLSVGAATAAEAIDENFPDDADFAYSPIDASLPLVVYIPPTPAGTYTLTVRADAEAAATLTVALLNSAGTPVGTASAALTGTVTALQLSVTSTATADRVRFTVA